MSNIQDLKHRRGTGICYEQIVNERAISDALERQVEQLVKERDAARKALRDAVFAANKGLDYYKLAAMAGEWRKAAGLEELCN